MARECPPRLLPPALTTEAPPRHDNVMHTLPDSGRPTTAIPISSFLPATPGPTSSAPPLGPPIELATRRQCPQVPTFPHRSRSFSHHGSTPPQVECSPPPLSGPFALRK